MLILTRRIDEVIRIGNSITITILDIGNAVSIGIDAPRDKSVHREEVYQRIVSSNQQPETVKQ